MADNHRNQNSGNRFSDQEWDNDYNRQQRNWEEGMQGPNQGYQPNRDYGYSGSRSRFDRQQEEYGNGGFRDSGTNQGNFNRGSNREYNQGRFGNDYNSGNQDKNYGYGGREYGSNYGGGGYQGNPSYYDTTNFGNSGRPSYGNSRNLYDRDYEGYNRGSGSTSMGGSNYGGWNQRGYGESPFYGSTNPRNYSGYSGSNYGGNYGGAIEDRQRYGRGDTNERSWWDRTRDEVSSWFGDDDAERRRDRDRMQNHRGKGPRNYNRSDDRIREDVNDRLSDDTWVDASEIEVTVNNGEVTLTGTVSERSEKRRAEDIAESVSGVKHVENRLRTGKRQEAGTYSSSAVPGSSATGTTGTSGTATASEKNKSKASYVTG